MKNKGITLFGGEWVQYIASLFLAGSLKHAIKMVEHFSRWAAAAA